jgi:hypothetical protein
MAHKVFKYEITGPECKLQLPKGAVPLCVAGQDGKVCLWARIDDSRPLEWRTFVGIGTGWDVPDGNLSYIGTAHGVDGWMVFHIFEATED